MRPPSPSPPQLEPRTFRVLEWLVDPKRGTLARGDQVERLEPRVMDVLVYLADNPNRVVSKQQIIDNAWGGRFVDELAVARCISKIRKALGESTDEPQSIRTFPKRGYAYCPDESPRRLTVPRVRRRQFLWLAGSLGFAAIGLLLWGVARSGSEQVPLQLALLPFAGSNEIEASLGRALVDDLSVSLTELEELEIILPEATRNGGRGRKPGKNAMTLRGSIRSHQDGLRVVAQPIDSRSGQQLWASSFVGRDQNQLLDQLELAEEISASVLTQLQATDLVRASFGGPRDRRTHELLLRGLAAYRRGNRVDNERAIEHFRNALVLDNRSAPIHAGLANALSLRSAVYGRGSEHVVHAIEHANLALELEPKLADAFKARGTALHFLGRLDQALADYEQALELEPALEEALFNKAVVLRQQGRHAEALSVLSELSAAEDPHALTAAEISHNLHELGFDEQARDWSEIALAESPLSAHANAVRIRGDLLAGKLSHAARRVDRLLVAHPLDGGLLRLRSEIALLRGREDLAAMTLRQSFESVSDGFEDIDRVRFASLLPMESPDSQQLLDNARQRLLRRIGRGVQLHDYPRALALIAAVEGDHTRAVDRLEDAIAAGHRDWQRDLLEPLFADLAQDPSFVRLLKSMQGHKAKERARALARGLPSLPDLGTPFGDLGRPFMFRQDLVRQ